MIARTPEQHPKSYLALSVAPELLTRDDRSAAERLEDLLELRDRALARGMRRLASWYDDRIVSEMTGGLA